jgi:hypothetical protein
LWSCVDVDMGAPGSGYNLYGRLLVPGGVTTAEWL